MKNTLKDEMLEFVGEVVETFLHQLKFKNPEEVTAALQFLADEIEGIDPDLIFAEMIPDASSSDREED